MSLTCLDWRTLDAATVEPLLTAEAALWLQNLDWDLTDAWRAIEPARAAGRLPGFVATDAEGNPRGWTCFLLHEDTLQVATLVAADAAAAQALVHAISQSPETSTAGARIAFIRVDTPGVVQAFVDEGFAIARYAYRARPIAESAQRGTPGRPWQTTDVAAVTTLAQRAYAGSTDVRAFAPRGLDEEWRDYMTGLLSGPGCGRFLRNASLVVPGGGTRLDAAVLVTALSPHTAHVAQVMVDPDARGRGLGDALVQQAMGEAAAMGFSQMTLLVAETNAPAVRLYDGLGFDRRGTFLAAADTGADQPWRLTSRAFATGGVSTRR